MRGVVVGLALMVMTACGDDAPPDVRPACEGAPALQVDGASLCQWAADGSCGVCTLPKGVGLYEVDDCRWRVTHEIPHSELARSESEPPGDDERDLMLCLDIVDGNPGGEWSP